MITQEQIDGLRSRMMLLRRAVQEQRVEERDVGKLIQEASHLLEQVTGTPYESSVRTIMELMKSIGDVTRKQQLLRCAGRSGGSQVLSSQTYRPISQRPYENIKSW